MQVETEPTKEQKIFEVPMFHNRHQVKTIECYFAEVNDLAQQMDFSEAHEAKPTSKPIHYMRQKRPNCYVQIESEGLLIMSKGGSSFHIPLEQQIENVFPLSEGLLIQYVIKQDPKFSEILAFQKNKHMLMTMEDSSKYSYVTLNKHPLNPLKVLGCLRKEEIQPWLNIPEKIVFASRDIPLLISYNHLLQRNAFHLLKANIEQSDREFQKVNFIHNFYTIKDLSEAQSGSYEMLAEMFFEENTRQLSILEALVTQGRNYGDIYVYLLIQNELHRYVKVYSIALFDGCQVRLVTKIPDVVAFSGLDLFQKLGSLPKLISVYDSSQNHKDLQVQILVKAIKKLPQYVVMVDHSNYYICLNGSIVYRMAILLNNKAVQIKKANFISKSKVQLESLANIMFEYLIINGISHPLVCILMKIFSKIIEQKMFQKMLGDFLYLRSSASDDFHCLQQYLFGLMKERSPHTVSQARSVTPQEFAPTRTKILKILHLLYEESKLHEHFNQRNQLLKMLYLLNAQCQDDVSHILCDYYVRQGAQGSFHERALIKNELKNDPELINIFKSISELFQVKKSQWELGPTYEPQKVPTAFRRTKFVMRFIELLLDGRPNHRSYIPDGIKPKEKNEIMGSGMKFVVSDNYPLHHQKVFYMNYYRKKIEGFFRLKEVKENAESKEEKVFLHLIEKGISLEKIKTFPIGISTPIYEILRIMRRHLPTHLYEVIPKLGFRLIRREDLHKNIKLYRKTKIRVPYHLQNQSLNSTIHTLIPSSMSEEYYLTSNTFQMNKLNNDLIFKEVTRLLGSVTDIKIKAKEIESIPEDKWEVESQSIVMKFANRRLSVLVGQGAFTLGTSQTYITEVIKINKINLSAIMPNDMKVNLDLKEDKEFQIYWPEFHNGVATGLRLSRHIIPLSQQHLKTWIFYQKPELPRRDHSGFLLSLGLLGYLQCFSPTDIYQYLKPNNEFTSAAILLGVSASNIGRCEQSLSKTLILHIPCLLPPTVDIEIPINVQSSALIGIGLLHKGTSNRTMTEMTLSQIGRRPNSDKCLDREGYSLAAGWALGVICLGMNGTREGLKDLQLEQRLIRFIEGGKTMEPPQSMISSNFNNENKCSSIKEGSNVNLHITAPAALLAISLMYLKSNNREVSNQITIPNSFNTIEQCNPNLILLKVIAKNLIMWKNINNTQQYITHQIPELIKFIFQSSLNNVHERYYLVYNVAQIDYHSMTVIYASIMTGAVVAMGMKYAGTGDKKAVSTILWHIDKLKGMKILKCQLANDPANKNSIDQYTLFTLLCVSLLSLSLIMAGTCDVECLKVARIIRKRIQETTNFHYGFNMAINMAFGFLCLGYGNYSFNRSDMSIAALLLSIYPYFPNSPSDNKWHLQALRHFYVLAVEQKVFHAVDVDTNKVVNVNVEMEFKSSGELLQETLHTPVLLQESKKLEKLRVRDEDYFDIDFSFENCQQPKVIYIKKKFSKDIDLHHFKSLNPQDYEHLPVTSETASDIKKAFSKETKYRCIKDLSSRSMDQNLVGYILPSSKNQQVVLAVLKKHEEQPRFWTNLSFSEIFYEFMKEDRLDLLETYIALLCREPNMLSWRVSKMDNLKLLKKFYESSQLIRGIDCQSSVFFNPTKLGLLYGKYESIALEQFDKLTKTEAFKHYLTKPDHNSALPPILIKVFNFFNVPSKHELKLIKKFFEKLSSNDGSRNRQTKETFNKNLISVCEMYLYMSFPSCPVRVLNQLADFFLQL